MMKRPRATSPGPDLTRGSTVRQHFARTFGEAYMPSRRGKYRKKHRLKVFLSHPNGDELVTACIHAFSDYLKKKSKIYTPWCDKDHVGKPGEALTRDMMRDMIQALEECDLVVVALPEGAVSNWIIAENRQAKTMKKYILVVYFGKAKIKPGMVRSAPDGYLRVDASDPGWKEAVCAAMDRVVEGKLEYEEF